MYEVESGEITTPAYASLNDGMVYCSFYIQVPKGRRITLEIIKGKKLAQTCESNNLPENALKEKLIVNINN